MSKEYVEYAGDIYGNIFYNTVYEYPVGKIVPYPVITLKGEKYTLKEGYSESHKEQYVSIVKKFSYPSIVDFGGGAAINYQILNGYPCKYFIVETESTCCYARHTLDIDYIYFVDDITNIKEEIDIFYSNSSIQYMLDVYKVIQYVDTILNPKFILIQRTFFTPKETYLTKQRGIENYVWIFNLADFVESFTNYTYQILPEYDFPSYNYCLGSYDEICKYKPILFTRKQ